MAAGFVDVALFGKTSNIAVEISVGTSQQFEVGNTLNCLQKNLQLVLLASHDRQKLQSIEEKVRDVVYEGQLAKLRYLMPEELVAFLDEQGAQNASGEKTVRSYKVKVNNTAVDTPRTQLSQRIPL